VFNRTAALQRPGPQTAQAGRVLVPVKGVNTIPALSNLGPEECHYAYNIVPSEGGLRTRLGQAEWTNGVTGSVRTIIPFHGKAADGSGDKLFATGSDGIYNCSTAGASQAAKVETFATTGSTAGYGPFINWTNDAGAQFLQYADSANGLLEYDPATGAPGDWIAVTSITGITETNIRFVTVHKLRIWYCLADNPNPYYLPVRSKTGAAAAFNLASQYTIGGDCAGVFTLSHDSGDGPDDYFVAVSRGGDVLMYQGDDPSSDDTWGLVGRWQIGAIPAGRKFAIEYGGDVLILSAHGLVSVKELMAGYESIENVNSLVGKVAAPIRKRMTNEITSDGWEVVLFESDGYLVIQSPQRAGDSDEWTHYVLSTPQKGWGFWRDVESISMGKYKGQMYYGRSNGSVWRMTGSRDNVTIADTTGQGIEFSLLTGYSDVGHPGLQKMGALVRPFFTSAATLEYDTKILYDFNVSELASSGDTGVTPGSKWDAGKWDAALWSGDATYDSMFGAGGIGVSLAVAIRGTTTSRSTLNEITAAFQVGSYL